MGSDKGFFLGKVYDINKKKVLDEKVIYDPSDLTTHGIVTGMTGSGKTGFCIGLLEEAALQGIPAIVVDPKGDLTNLVLHFPDQLPADFEPWIDPDAAMRQNKTTAQLAEETAKGWKEGLASWGLGKEQLLALKNSAKFTIFTPGSTAGHPVNILSSFEAPVIPWEENRELLREKIASTVTALLGLIGLKEIDPLRSREHILLSNLIENAWSQGKSLDLPSLILQTQKPPIERLGAFAVDTFFPEQDRFELAMLLNNFLAAPSFETWLEGQPLDIDAILFTKDQKPRHSIFYMAHLSDNERMFFTTLLFAAIETWMFTQRGTGSLRAIVYFDEIMGYMPPVANPPSRPILLRLLKQARAFGLGLLLATQNPVDVDYKALSNAGTWVIGRLQTDQDKQRLLDGLQSATGTLDRNVFDRLISGLSKRVFLLHNVHESKPVVFTTRWAMNYLAGPLTRTQIPALNALAGSPVSAKISTSRDATKGPLESSVMGTATGVSGGTGLASERPAAPSGVDEYFLPFELDPASAAREQGTTLPANVTAKKVFYKPTFLTQAQVRYFNKKYGINLEKRLTSVVDQLPGGLPRWEEFNFREIKPEQFQNSPQPNSHFHPIPSWLGERKKLDDLQKDFTSWIYRTAALEIFVNEEMNLASKPGESRQSFITRCQQAARTQPSRGRAGSEYERRIQSLKQKIATAELKVKRNKDEVGQRNVEMGAKALDTVFGLLTRRKRSLSPGVTKFRMAQEAKADLELSEKNLEDLKQQLQALEQEQQAGGIGEVEMVSDNVIEIPISPQQRDIYVEYSGILWLPYYQLENGIEFPAYKNI
jgi:hypothetical protein